MLLINIKMMLLLLEAVIFYNLVESIFIFLFFKFFILFFFFWKVLYKENVIFFVFLLLCLLKEILNMEGKIKEMKILHYKIFYLILCDYSTKSYYFLYVHVGQIWILALYYNLSIFLSQYNFFTFLLVFCISFSFN